MSAIALQVTLAKGASAQLLDGCCGEKLRGHAAVTNSVCCESMQVPLWRHARAQDEPAIASSGSTDSTDAVVNSNHGPLGPVQLGATVGAGLPNILSVSGLFKVTPYFGGGVNFGLIPTIRVSFYGDATVRYQEFDVFGRAYPFGGGFFLGIGIGYETVSGTLHDSLNTSSFAYLIPANLHIPNPLVYDSAGSVRSLILTPQIGYLYTTDIGFSFGIDAGAQVPLAASQVSFATQLAMPPGVPQEIQNQVRTQLVQPNDARVRDTLKTIGQTPLPTISVRIGWMF